MKKTNKQHWANLLNEMHADNVSSVVLPAADGTKNSSNDNRAYADTWRNELEAIIEEDADNAITLSSGGATLLAYNFELDGLPVCIVAIEYDTSDPEGCVLLDGHITTAFDLAAAWLGNTSLDEHDNHAILDFAKMANYDDGATA